MEPYYWLIGAAVVVLVLIFSHISVVPQASEYVIERIGKYHTTWRAGLHVRMPIVDKIVNRVTTKERVLDSPPQDVITKDNVTMKIDAVVFYRIFDPKLYTYGSESPDFALNNLTATTLRNIVGELELDETLTSRDTINGKMAVILDEATDKWGIKVTRVELKNILPPTEIRNAMEKQMKAERDRRETLLQAEGHRAAAIERAEGDKRAMILEAEGERDSQIARAEGEAKAIYLKHKAEADGLAALMAVGVDGRVIELKKYEALVEMANGTAAKIIVPTDIVDTVKKNTFFSETTGIGNSTDPAPAPVPEPVSDPCCERFENRDADPADE